MKIKHFLISCAALCPIAFILRLVQHFTVVDASGYFLLGGSVQKILSWSVYGVIVITALLAIATYFSRPKVQADFDVAVGGKAIGILFIICAIVTIFTSGVFFTSASYDFVLPITPEKIPDILTVVSAVLGIFTALHFAFVGMSALSRNKWAIARTLSIFSPIYFALLGIREFYSTFDSAGKSETKLIMLTICASALFFISLTLAHTNSEIYNGRVAAFSGLLAVVSAVTGPAYLILMIIGKTAFDTVYFAQSLLHTALMIISLCVLTRVSFIEPENDDEEIEPIEFSPLDKFLNEIPDEDRGNDE